MINISRTNLKKIKAKGGTNEKKIIQKFFLFERIFWERRFPIAPKYELSFEDQPQKNKSEGWDSNPRKAGLQPTAVAAVPPPPMNYSRTLHI